MKSKKAILWFLIITFFLSGICYYLRIAGGNAAAGMTSVLMFCPGTAAIIVHRIYYRGEKNLGWNRCSLKYVIAGAIIPAVYFGLSYGAYWIVIKNSFSGRIYTNPIGLLFLIPSFLLTAAGEEIGWRGFLLPQLAKTWNIRVAVLFGGLIWAVWHFPLILSGHYLVGTPVWYKLPVFTIEILAMTAILAALRLRSNSIWPAVVLHASHNYIDYMICSPMTENGVSLYFVGETGIITAVIACLIAVILVNKKSSRMMG